MKKQLFTGSGTALITPMHPDGSPNYEVLTALIEFQIEAGADALVVCGLAGEGPALDDGERLDVIEHCAKMVNKRVPVVAATGFGDTRRALAFAKEASVRGADGLLQAAPYYYGLSGGLPGQKGPVRHFLSIAEAVGLPTVLYGAPCRAGLGIAVDTYRELAAHPLILAVAEAGGDISHIAALAEACGEELAVYAGRDDQILPVLSLGGIGVISVLANLAPQDTGDICRLYFSGRQRQALALQLHYLPLIRMLEGGESPFAIKEALKLMGYAAGDCRPPLDAPASPAKEALKREMKRAGII